MEKFLKTAQRALKTLRPVEIKRVKKFLKNCPDGFQRRLSAEFTDVAPAAQRAMLQHICLQDSIQSAHPQFLMQTLVQLLTLKIAVNQRGEEIFGRNEKVRSFFVNGCVAACLQVIHMEMDPHCREKYSLRDYAWEFQRSVFSCAEVPCMERTAVDQLAAIFPPFLQENMEQLADKAPHVAQTFHKAPGEIYQAFMIEALLSANLPTPESKLGSMLVHYVQTKDRGISLSQAELLLGAALHQYFGSSPSLQPYSRKLVKKNLQQGNIIPIFQSFAAESLYHVDLLMASDQQRGVNLYNATSGKFSWITLQSLENKSQEIRLLCEALG